MNLFYYFGSNEDPSIMRFECINKELIYNGHPYITRSHFNIFKNDYSDQECVMYWSISNTSHRELASIKSGPIALVRFIESIQIDSASLGSSDNRTRNVPIWNSGPILNNIQFCKSQLISPEVTMKGLIYNLKSASISNKGMLSSSVSIWMRIWAKWRSWSIS